MPCLIALVAVLSPRLAIFFVWLFYYDRVAIAFSSMWIGFIGFLFLPWTTLAWIICYQPLFGVTDFGWFVIIFGFVVDMSSYASGFRSRGSRQQQVYQ